MVKTRGNPYLKWLDRYVGIPLITVLGVFKGSRVFPKEPKTIGFLKLAGMGDLIVLSGVIKDTQKKYPKARIVLFCSRNNQSIAPFISGVTEVKVLSVINFFKSMKMVRAFKCDLLIDCEQWSRIDVLLSFFAGAKHTIGFKTKGQFRHKLFDQVTCHKACHEIENFRELVKLAHVKSLSNPSLKLRPRTLKSHASYVIFHPWSISRMNALKEWPLDHWVKLGKALWKQGYTIYVTGSQKDTEATEQLIATLNKETDIAISLAGKTTLPQLSDYLKKAQCVISVDTGVMHLAAALKAPLIALFGPTSPKRWGPISDNAITLSTNDPYMYLGFEKPTKKVLGMEAITVTHVLDKFNSLILQSRARARARARKKIFTTQIV